MDLQGATATLFREAFEGRAEGEDHTWFVQGREAILPTLEGLDAFAASRRPGHDLPTLAAHAYHLRYILQWLNVPAGDAPPEGEWESTWAKEAVTDEEWASLLGEIRERYARALEWLAATRIGASKTAPSCIWLPFRTSPTTSAPCVRS